MSPFLGGSDSKASAYNAKTWVQSLGQEDLLEKEMATHSTTLAWKIPWTEEPGGLQSMELQRVGHNWVTSLSLSPDVSRTIPVIQFPIASQLSRATGKFFNLWKDFFFLSHQLGTRLGWQKTQPVGKLQEIRKEMVLVLIDLHFKINWNQPSAFQVFPFSLLFIPGVPDSLSPSCFTRFPNNSTLLLLFFFF